MYNGIGLQTARGSGTSGYVQKNLSTVNKSHKKHDFPTEQDIQRMEASLNKPPNQELLSHQKKRQIELKCLEERERLEAQGYDDSAIETRLTEYREQLKIKMEEIAKIKEPTPKSELFKCASSTRNSFWEKRNRRSTSRGRSPPPSEEVPQITQEPSIVNRSSPPPKVNSSPKYSLVPTKLRRVSSSRSPSTPRERRRSPSREKKSKKSRRKSPKRRSSSRNRRSRSRSRSRSRDRKTKSRRRTSKSRRHKSKSRSRSRSKSSRSKSKNSRSKSRSSHSRSPSRESPPRKRRSRSSSRTRKRKVSPNFRESRRITSARKRPTPYQRFTSSDSESGDGVSPCRYRLNGSSSKHWSGKYSSPDSSIDSM